jgi:hypothetical protein
MVKGYSYRFEVLSIRGQIIGDISAKCYRGHQG